MRGVRATAHKGFRGAISLIAAYLLVVQAFVTAVAVTNAAAANAQNFGLPLVICSGEHGSADTPASHHEPEADCCLACTVAAGSVSTIADAVEVVLRRKMP